MEVFVEDGKYVSVVRGGISAETVRRAIQGVLDDPEIRRGEPPKFCLANQKGPTNVTSIILLVEPDAPEVKVVPRGKILILVSNNAKTVRRLAREGRADDFVYLDNFDLAWLSGEDPEARGYVLRQIFRVIQDNIKP